MEETIKKISKYNFVEIKKYCLKKDLNILNKIKLYLDNIYYNTPGEINFPDEKYDIIKDIVILKNKNNPEYKIPIGYSPILNKINLPYHMGSLDKITDQEPEKLKRWIQKNPSSIYITTPKLDGISALLEISSRNKKLYTRGDGTQGTDISHLFKYISIPILNKISIVVRGELIISQHIFQKKYSSHYKNSRNMVSGLVNSKTLKNEIKDIEFIAYEIISDKLLSKPSRQLKKLKKLGFNIVPSHPITYKFLTISNLKSLLKKIKTESNYLLDGLVIQTNQSYDRNKDGNPKYSFAFKSRDTKNIAQTIVKDIEWSISSWGNIIPIAILKPVNIMGCTISRVTVSNASLLKKRKIGPGAIVMITRSNDVIPYILEVRKECKKLKWPTEEFKWDSNRVHIQANCEDKKIHQVTQIKHFSEFFSKMKIKFVSDATVKKMWNGGLNSLDKIIGATHQDLLQIFKQKTARRIYENIKKGLQNINISELLAASGVFGYGIGRKKLIALIHNIPDLLDLTPGPQLKNKILNVEGFSEITCNKIIQGHPEAIDFIKKIKSYIVLTQQTKISNALINQKFVISGFRCKQLENDIKARGGNISSVISKKTNALILANLRPDKLTNKIKKAIDLKIPMYNKQEFINKFFNPSIK